MKLRTRGGYFWVDAKYWDAETGTRVRVQRSTGIVDDGTAAAERTAQMIAEDICRSVALNKKRRAVATVADAFRANLAAKRRANRSESTISIVAEKQAQIEAYFGADRDLATIKDADFEAYADAGRKAGRAASTVLRELRELSIGYRALKLEPPKMPDLGRVHTPRERWFDAEQSARLIACAPKTRREHVLAYRLMGLRKSELFRISREDVDTSGEPWMVRVRGTKSEAADRWVPLHKDLVPVFTRRMKERPDQLFEDWQRGNADRDLRAAAEKAKLGPASFNDLRRSFAMEMLRAGVPTREVSELLGHTSTRMVEAHYARLRPGRHLASSVGRLRGGYVTESVRPPPPESEPAPRQPPSISDMPTQIYVAPPRERP